MSHTPGPWTCELTQDGILVSAADGAYVTWNHGPDEDAANLRLMAAAPDLLAALKELRDGAYGNPFYPEDTVATNARADAAIAKAEGRSHPDQE